MILALICITLRDHLILGVIQIRAQQIIKYNRYYQIINRYYRVQLLSNSSPIVISDTEVDMVPEMIEVSPNDISDRLLSG